MYVWSRCYSGIDSRSYPTPERPWLAVPESFSHIGVNLASACSDRTPSRRVSSGTGRATRAGQVASCRAKACAWFLYGRSSSWRLSALGLCSHTGSDHVLLGATLESKRPGSRVGGGNETTRPSFDSCDAGCAKERVGRSCSTARAWKVRWQNHPSFGASTVSVGWRLPLLES